MGYPSASNKVINGGVPTDVTRAVRIEGHNPSIGGGGVWNDIWEGGSLIIPDPNPSGQQMQVFSSSGNDTALGTGARIVRLQYITPSGDILFEDIQLNGTTPVLTVATDIAHIGDLFNKTVGSNEVSVGEVDISDVGDKAKIYNRIASGGNKSLSTLRFVPLLSEVYVTSITISGDTKGTDVILRSDSDDSGNVYPGTWLFQVPITMSDAPTTIFFNPAVKIPGGAKTKVSARAGAAGNTVSVFVNGWLREKL